MTKIIYLLSDYLDYGRLICDDAGPGYAASMGWESINISAHQQIKSHHIVMVDNRIQVNEFDALKKIIEDNPSTSFFLKIVDPFYENRDHPYYNFLIDMAWRKNVYLLSVYQATELTEEISKLYNNRFITLPYPYLKDKEVNNVAGRKAKIIISGSINKDIYPYRYQIWLKITRSWARIFFPILKHPGYAELDGTLPVHSIIKDEYIAYLAKFKYMLLCPTRCMIELLKFNECAYAGCIPVGLPPNSYPEDIKKLFLRLRISNFYSDMLNILLINDKLHNVKKLRDYLSETHNPDVLNAYLIAFVNENPIHTS